MQVKSLPHQRHSLVVGGTGMLREASLALARSSDMLTSVARTPRSLAALDARMPEGCTHHALALDWNRRDAFLGGLQAHFGRVGMPQRALVWMHGDALVPAIADGLEAASSVCRLFHVRGSASAGPSRTPSSPRVDANRHRHVRYRGIVLGFVLQGTRSRWLRDAEIVAGVVDAIAADRECSVVGTVEPWSRRP